MLRFVFGARPRFLSAGVSVTLLLAAACAAPATQSASSSRGAESTGAASPRAERTGAVLAVGSELALLSDRFGTNTYQDNFQFMLTSPLVPLDAQGQPHPLLATEQPSQDRGTW